MKFGVFDQNDRSGLPLAEQYEARLSLAEHYDRLGFHCFHMSEHHGTSLSMAPSPSVWMAALTQRTKRLRLCPLVYLLPTYHPARLYEEICILDNLSGGRFEFGIGRGASPHELDALGIDSAKAASMYAEAFETIRRCFEQDSVTTTGEFWSLKDYVVEMKPYQRPCPPMWYAVGSPDSVVWPARNGLNVVCGGPVSRVRAISDRYREEREAAGLRSGTEPLIGVNRYIIVGETDREAHDIGRKAWPTFYESFIKLWRKHGTEPVNAKLPPSFDQLVDGGHAIAGSARTVAEMLSDQVSRGGLNYVIGSFMFGSMLHADATASVHRFAEDVMPAVEAREAVLA
ncbi:Flavin-dependent oxidoreductase, luciferase family (includes alkanesulfonate monooxygenase SsuD and methylene tetrahydromethanopterin reductase) [Rhizobiales bacterium GAS191]|jgi:alkanesulfonate monooxygenase SsuD/methylene tetrahydromethanopterin reductase-like flavin-dependent oxidoreductase (luciferase family)|nr:Flavin-dependent oxidoreductase, luciferase family (includes alkanesulfonate monooxygenase SsuD and methylene tetrahydromethanopterin reductase) [Rhizobiales bacterium GAS113]SED78270.1 Flavin-dependent oxidoreductase, luciferase family (includes alkanesulfonate monooxygenase SsuD and methylene tetrahydromethanopterin reductase) [Rhizobiales bacterium GAS191]SEE68417.1 Flavin-dependent oxidoreductase, luciferase family (includes alkanesulfonate monooxygenase SsuD and methylene tetrahydromethan